MSIFSSFLPTVHSLFEDINQELAKYLVESNVHEEWVDHDNWNGGIDFYNIIVDVPVDVFKSLRHDRGVESVENELSKCYADAMRGEGESIQIRNVIIRPSKHELPQLGEEIDDSMWKPGYFRLFISHLSGNSSSARNLKKCLLNFGIDGFVAHEDISPMQEWEKEIESALFTLDALCAMVVPKFKQSEWCDQEIGIALGRRKTVLSIKKGEIPYGFLHKYQALPNKETAYDMAEDVKEAICVNENTRKVYLTRLINLVLNASSESQALSFIQILLDSKYLDKQYVTMLHDNISGNNTIMTDQVLSKINPLFQRYGLSEIIFGQNNSETDNGMDLPF